MTHSRMIAVLYGVFLASLTVNGFVLLHFHNFMNAPNEGDLVSEILRVHAMPLGVLLGALFVPKPKKSKVPPLLLGIAVAASVVWAVLLGTSWFGYPVRIVASSCGDTPGVEQILTRRAGDVSFLIAAILTYASGRHATAD